MSAYKKIECNIVDKDTLLEALKTLGFKPEVFVEPTNLKGYMGDTRKEVAHIIIPRDQVNFFTGASNDIGFFWDEKMKNMNLFVQIMTRKNKWILE